MGENDKPDEAAEVGDREELVGQDGLPQVDDERTAAEAENAEEQSAAEADGERGEALATAAGERTDEHAAAEEEVAEEHAAAEEESAEERAAAEEEATEEHAVAEEASTEERAAAEEKVADEHAAAGGESTEEQIVAEAQTQEEHDATDEDEVPQGGLWPVDRLKPVLEAVLFAAADAVPVKRICQLVEGATKPEVTAALEKIQADSTDRGFRLMEVAGGWQFRTAPEHHEMVRKLFKEKPQRLSRAMVETLSVIAYKQPATRAEVEAVRGVDSSGVMEGLVERRLVKIAGRRDVPGRPLVYVTTQDFLEVFGLNDIKSLPTLPELGDDFQVMADRAGFEEGEERDANIIPLEEGDLGHETEAVEGEHQEELGATDSQAHADDGDGQAGQPEEAGAADQLEEESPRH